MKTMGRALKRARSSAAQLVEAAIVMPLLITLLLAVVGGAPLFRTQMMLEAASADAARAASTSLDSSATLSAATVASVEKAIASGCSIPAGVDIAVEKASYTGDTKSYTMTVYDESGAVKATTRAKTVWTRFNVTASATCRVLGLGEVMLSSSHVATVSKEGA